MSNVIKLVTDINVKIIIKIIPKRHEYNLKKDSNAINHLHAESRTEFGKNRVFLSI